MSYERLIVTAKQHSDGYVMPRPDGSTKVVYYVDGVELPDGTIEVACPGDGPLFAGSNEYTPPRSLFVSNDEAIIAADAALRAKKQAVDEEKARKLAERKARAEEWAAIPLELRTADDYPGYCCPMGEAPNGYRGPLFCSGLAIFDVQDLQRFVPQAWEEADRACAQRRERKEYQQAIADRALLAAFLASFPADAFLLVCP
jgi:hypothetical protein